MPKDTVRDWGKQLLRSKDFKTKNRPTATQFIDDGLERLGFQRGGKGLQRNPKSIESPDFVGTLYKGKITLPGVKTTRIHYQKVERAVLDAARAKFNSTHRRNFLKGLASDPAKVEKLKSAGLSDVDIADMKRGTPPDKYRVHHKFPLDGGGTNDPSNLILIQEDPYHKTITNFQNDLIRGMKPGDHVHVDYPTPDGFIYPP